MRRVPSIGYLRDRVALIYVPEAPAAARNIGSGYFVDHRRVITAAHVVGEPGSACRVCPLEGAFLDARVVWCESGSDLAVLDLVHDEDAVPEWAPAAFGAVRGDRRLACRAVGFPDVHIRHDTEGRTVRAPENIEGDIDPETGDRTTELTIHVRGSVPRRTDTGATRWAGISGAALFVEGAIVGVLRVDPAAFDAYRLVATPLTAIADRDAFAGALDEPGFPDLIPVGPADPHDDAHPRSPRTDFEVLLVAILLSGPLAYTYAIDTAFEGDLRARLEPMGVEPRCIRLTGPAAPMTTPGVEREWAQLAERLRRRAQLSGRQDHDYYIGIGTQASVALHRAGAGVAGGPPLVFLGVTDPVRSGLVDVLSDRDDDRPSAGVSYGPGRHEVLLSLVKRLFPDRTLTFFHEAGVPQDEAIAARFRELPDHRDGRLTVLRLEGRDLPRRVGEDPAAVYFSWYTLDRMLEDDSAAELLGRRDFLFLTTTESLVAEGLAVASIAADDGEIGRQGARLIVDHQATARPLGTVDVVTPPYRYTLNLDVAARHDLRFSDDVTARAARIYSASARGEGTGGDQTGTTGPEPAAQRP